MKYFADRPRPYWLVTAADLPWDAFPTFDEGGPACVAADGWGTSTSYPADHATGTGRRVNGYAVPYTGVRHWLDGAVFPTREQAVRAQYEAGLTARFVYADSEWATKLSATDTTPARLCDLCEEPFVPEPFADPEVCGSCLAENAEQRP